MFRVYSFTLLLLIFGNFFSNKFLLLPEFKKPIISKIKDINNKVYFLKNKIVVLVFLDTECPISQFYTKSLQKLVLEYENSNILFLTVFPTKYTHEEDIRSFNKKYKLNILSILDQNQILTKKLNATITPEVFVLNQKSEIVYFGSIDDSYFALGKRNINPQKKYLKDAIQSTIFQKKPSFFHIEAIGCEIQRIQ
jgi:thiol-disulfide isomerase/thioredoxin